jgi:uncharacterized SAM-binding protein YcdF (DUF218 family)
MILFAFKKIISGLTAPSSLIFFSLLAATFLLLRRKFRAARFSLCAGLAVALLSFFPLLPDMLIHRLEDCYSPFVPDTGSAPEWILVLGHSYKTGVLPETSRVDGTMYARLMETVRISKSLPLATVIIPLFGKASDAEKQEWLNSFCRNTGWSPDRVVILPDAQDTSTEIRQALRLINKEPFVLVTTASHMPRAIQISSALGGHAIPAPCDFESRSRGPLYSGLAPSVQNLERTETALHEYLGAAWFRLTRMPRDPEPAGAY